MDNKKTRTYIKIGDPAKCPQCSRIGRVVWISQDGKRAGIQCPAYHSQLRRSDSKFGSTMRSKTRPGKNMVFLVEI